MVVADRDGELLCQRRVPLLLAPKMRETQMQCDVIFRMLVHVLDEMS